MLLILIFVSLITTTIANHGVPWHIKLGYQNVDKGASQNQESLEGVIFSYENLFNRKVHSYFSTFTEISYSNTAKSITEDIRLLHCGFGIKWNFGPTDFDYDPASDYEFVLNQGSLYIKAGLGYTSLTLDTLVQNLRSMTSTNKEYSTQYGLGYELLGKRTGFFLEYMKSDSDIFNSGMMRAGVNWKF